MISKDQYLFVHRLMTKALHENFDAEETADIGEEEWTRDAADDASRLYMRWVWQKKYHRHKHISEHTCRVVFHASW